MSTPPQRAIRAIEIADHYATHPASQTAFPRLKALVIGLDIDRELRRAKISERLRLRCAQGLVEEVKGLLDKGLTPEELIYYGLEYKYVTLHVPRPTHSRRDVQPAGNSHPPVRQTADDVVSRNGTPGGHLSAGWTRLCPCKKRWRG